MPYLLFAYANDQERGPDFLRELPRERKAVKAALDLAEQMGLCQRAFIDDASAGDIITAFQQHEGQVTLFHYGGHAGSFDLLLQTDSGSGNQVAGGEGLVSFLGRQRGLQLVVLNGCHTYELATALTKAGVPVVIGTDRAVDDEVATLWASRFHRGLSVGLSIRRAFDDAVDEVRMSPQGNNLRQMGRRRKTKSAAVPWRIHIAPGKEDAVQWSLTQYNPLLGLPEPPNKTQLPEHPFLFFRRYDRAHAPVYFGRAQHIRLLYDRIANDDSPSLILLHGQSGSGKSSLFEAGLVPRLEADYTVRYLVRDPQKGLSNTLLQCLSGLSFEQSSTPSKADAPSEEISTLLAQLEAALQKEPHNRSLLQQLQGLRTLRQSETTPAQPISQENNSSELRQWLQIEQSTGKPLVIILDQLEEVFTRNEKEIAEIEWAAFLKLLTALFSDNSTIPKGKLILGFRKEFYPEVDKAFKQAVLPRSSLFLPTLTRPEIEEIVLGLSSRQELRDRYHLTVDPDLPPLIANDLLQQQESAVAPILQILLTNMWEAARETAPHEPHFSVKLYRDIKSRWWQLESFVAAQTANIARDFPEEVEKGLHLDLLYQFTTPAATAQSRSLEELLHQYQHSPKIEALLNACDQQLLLRKGTQIYSLSHDTLAPILRRMYQQSDRPGQRARRIVAARVEGSGDHTPKPLDRHDLAQVKEGKAFMRTLHSDEEELLKRSATAERRRKLVVGAFSSLLVLAIAATLFLQQRQIQMEETVSELRSEEETLRIQIQSQEAEVEQVENLLTESNSTIQKNQSEIQELEKSSQLLSNLAQRNQARANQAERRFIANQGATEALAFLQDGKKYEALKAVEAAYRADSKSPTVLGTLLELVYDPAPVFQPMSASYTFLPEDLHPLGYKIENAKKIHPEIRTSDGKVMYHHLPNDFVMDVQFVESYPNRAYLKEGMEQEERVVIWEPLQQTSLLEPLKNGIGLEVMPSSGTLMLAEENGKLYQQDGSETGNLTPILAESLIDMAIAPDGQHLVTAQASSLQLYQTAPFAQKNELLQDDRSLAFNRIRISKKGRYLVASQSKGQATIYSLQSNTIREIQSIVLSENSNARVIDALLSPDERYLIGIDNSKQIHFWDWKIKKSIASDTFLQSLNLLSFSPDGRHLLVGGAEGAVYLIPWKGAKTTFSTEYKINGTPDGNVTDIAFSKGEIDLLAIAAGKKVYLYSQSGNLPIWNYDFGNSVKKIRFSIDGKQLWVLTTDGLLKPLLLDPDQLIAKIITQRYIHPEL